MISTTIADLAKYLNGYVIGDESFRVTGIATLETANNSNVSFLTKNRYLEVARKSEAGCIIVNSENKLDNKNLIVVSDSHLAYVKAMYYFYPEEKPSYRVSSNAHIDDQILLPKNVRIEDGVIIGRGCILGEGVVLHAGAIIKEYCKIGDGCVIHPGVVLYPRTQIGKRVVIHANAVLGSDGFGYYLGGKSPLKVPQVGQVIVGDDVEIGVCTCIERATLDKTIIGNRVKIGEHVVIGHNAIIGDDVVITGQSGISGSVEIERAARIWGRVFVRGHLTIGEGALVLANSFVTKSVPKDEVVGGAPAIPHFQWKRSVIAFAKLPELIRKIRGI